MKAIPKISKFMTTVPLTIGTHVTLKDAQKIMDENSIRHLPVLEGGSVVGVISDRDLKSFASFKGVDYKVDTVAGFSSLDPFTVSPEATLGEVCGMMAENKYGCALIKDNNKIVGIFTWVDALRAMQELLATRLKK